MTLTYTANSSHIDWERLRQDLIDDDFHNGRTTRQLELSFENSQIAVYALDGSRCVATARALSDGVGNAYVLDVWTHSGYRRQQIASRLMNTIIETLPGQHIYLFTDDQVAFYKNLGFRERPVGLELISGEYLENDTRYLS